MPESPPKRPVALTKEQLDAIDLFRAWRVAEGLSLDQASDAIGYSAGTLSQVEDGSYGGRTDRVADAMIAHLDRVRSEDLAIKRPPLLKLDVATKIAKFCTEHRDSRTMGYLCGRKGVGKTSALRAFADVHCLDALLITCTKGYNSQAVLRELCDRLAIGWKGSEAATFPHVVTEIKRRHRPLIIVDDCDFLKAGIHAVRQIHDLAECGIVLSGTLAFLEWMRKHDTGVEGQAYSRIASCLRLDKITEEDGERLADFYRPSSGAWRRAWNNCGANARRLVQILMNAARFAGPGAEIAERHVDDALASMLPAEL